MNNRTHRAEALLAFYDEHKRALPFRLNPVPYHIWVSEIMLQQTRMETVLPYFQRFIEALPGVPELAAVSEERLFKLWEGLGYYSRARNLKKAAQVILAEYEGRLPGSFAELVRLPGIGPYTAGAIASIAFQEPVPAVDGNVIRVYSRLEAYAGDPSTAAGKRVIHEAVLKDLPKERPGDFNQAVMELGAMICLPKGDPLCSVCPVQSNCRAYQAGNPLDYPVLPARKARRREEQTLLLVCGAEGFLAEKRPAKGLLAGMNQFPLRAGSLERSAVVDWLAELGLRDYILTPGGRSRHIFSHVEWQLQAWEVTLTAARVSEAGLLASNGLKTLPASPGLFWESLDKLEAMAFPTAFWPFRDRLKELLTEGRDLKLGGV